MINVVLSSNKRIRSSLLSFNARFFYEGDLKRREGGSLVRVVDGVLTLVAGLSFHPLHAVA